VDLPSIRRKGHKSAASMILMFPPSLFLCCDIAKSKDIISTEYKQAGNIIVKFNMKKDEYELPDYEQVRTLYTNITKLMREGNVKSAFALGFGGIAEAVSKMAFGNKLGVKLSEKLRREIYSFPLCDGGKLPKAAADLLQKPALRRRKIQFSNSNRSSGNQLSGRSSPLEDAGAWTKRWRRYRPYPFQVPEIKPLDKLYIKANLYSKEEDTRPRVFIPVFPGTNCEYDTLAAFQKAGAEVETIVFRNMSEEHIRESVRAFTEAIQKAQILMFPGGFSAGDEPDGSGKFIATAFRNDRIKDAVSDLIQHRDGLVLGICNGFQALIKLGLLPYGEITPQKVDSPTLATNNIGRHISKSVYTKVVTNKSPWLMKAELGGVYSIPASHGEGRFVASEEWISNLFANGQVATQYVDLEGNPTMDEDFNPNGSYSAIEGITSPDGRVLGKMAHSERIGFDVAINIIGEKDQHIFESGVSYFR
jgi:phosphoribosylformylglycinamidine synthase